MEARAKIAAGKMLGAKGVKDKWIKEGVVWGICINF